MSALTNPYALGEWPSTPRQTFKSEDPISSPSVVNFRVVHPSTLHADGASVIAPVDILNCVVLDPYGRKYLSTSTCEVSLPDPSGKTGGSEAVAITYIHDSQNKVVGQVEWCTPYPVVQLNHAVSIPRQKSTYVFFESDSTNVGPSPSNYSLFVNNTLHSWAKGNLGEYRLFSYDNLRQPVLQVEAMQKCTGELELALTEAGLKRGLVDASLIALLFVLNGLARGYRF